MPRDAEVVEGVAVNEVVQHRLFAPLDRLGIPAHAVLDEVASIADRRLHMRLVIGRQAHLGLHGGLHAGVEFGDVNQRLVRKHRLDPAREHEPAAAEEQRADVPRLPIQPLDRLAVRHRLDVAEVQQRPHVFGIERPVHVQRLQVPVVNQFFFQPDRQFDTLRQAGQRDRAEVPPVGSASDLVQPFDRLPVVRIRMSSQQLRSHFRTHAAEHRQRLLLRIQRDPRGKLPSHLRECP